MIRSLRSVPVCLALLCLPVAATTAQVADPSLFYSVSAPASQIGRGEITGASTTNGWTFTAVPNFQLGVSVTIHSPGQEWFLDFAAPNGQPLQLDQYNNAQLWPTQLPGFPGMLFSGTGRTVPSLIGFFNVLALQYGPGGSILRFDVDFLQYDNAMASQWNQGSLRFHAVDPVPEPAPVVLALAGLLVLFVWRRVRPGLE